MFLNCARNLQTFISTFGGHTNESDLELHWQKCDLGKPHKCIQLMLLLIFVAEQSYGAIRGVIQ